MMFDTLIEIILNKNHLLKSKQRERSHALLTETLSLFDPAARKLVSPVLTSQDPITVIEKIHEKLLDGDELPGIPSARSAQVYR